MLITTAITSEVYHVLQFHKKAWCDVGDEYSEAFVYQEGERLGEMGSQG